MGEVVNLRRARKLRDRALKAEEAGRNRAAFGRTAAERDGSAAAAARHEAALDRHRRDAPPDAPAD